MIIYVPQHTQIVLYERTQTRVIFLIIHHLKKREKKNVVCEFYMSFFFVCVVNVTASVSRILFSFVCVDVCLKYFFAFPHFAFFLIAPHTTHTERLEVTRNFKITSACVCAREVYVTFSSGVVLRSCRGGRGSMHALCVVYAYIC